VPIDDKPPSGWEEMDLIGLCERRREGPRLEFKRELSLDTEGQKNEAERNAQGTANAGGGVILYGIEEAELLDDGTGAGAPRPIEDGALYERLNGVLDARGAPRLVFDLHPIAADHGRVSLVLDVSGRRRPHQASDGRYYMRRGTQVRRMSEAEVQEAYRDKLLRETTAARPILGERPDTELPPEVAARVHRGLTPAEMALRTEETGDIEPPGWLSVVVTPDPPRQELLDPIRDAQRFAAIETPDRWDTDHFPVQAFRLQPTLEGLRAQLPPNDEFAPAYLVASYRDGVMEYGTTLEPGLRRDDPAQNRGRIQVVVATLDEGGLRWAGRRGGRPI
jgi:Putative DNA-binding domain